MAHISRHLATNSPPMRIIPIDGGPAGGESDTWPEDPWCPAGIAPRSQAGTLVTVRFEAGAFAAIQNAICGIGIVRYGRVYYRSRWDTARITARLKSTDVPYRLTDLDAREWPPIHWGLWPLPSPLAAHHPMRLANSTMVDYFGGVDSGARPAWYRDAPPWARWMPRPPRGAEWVDAATGQTRCNLTYLSEHCRQYAASWD